MSDRKGLAIIAAGIILMILIGNLINGPKDSGYWPDGTPRQYEEQDPNSIPFGG